MENVVNFTDVFFSKLLKLEDMPKSLYEKHKYFFDDLTHYRLKPTNITLGFDKLLAELIVENSTQSLMYI